MLNWSPNTDTDYAMPFDTVVTEGIAASTLVATPFGWRPVQDLAVGDLVLTFDNGMQAITGLSSSSQTVGSSWPIHIAAGAIGNKVDLVVSAHQPVLVESDIAEDLLGDPFALVRAEALLDLAGVTPAIPDDAAKFVELEFAETQVVYAAGGGLLMCRGNRDSGVLSNVMPHVTTYNVLHDMEAKAVIEPLRAA